MYLNSRCPNFTRAWNIPSFKAMASAADPGDLRNTSIPEQHQVDAATLLEFTASYSTGLRGLSVQEEPEDEATSSEVGPPTSRRHKTSASPLKIRPARSRSTSLSSSFGNSPAMTGNATPPLASPQSDVSSRRSSPSQKTFGLARSDASPTPSSSSSSRSKGVKRGDTKSILKASSKSTQPQRYKLLFYSCYLF